MGEDEPEVATAGVPIVSAPDIMPMPHVSVNWPAA
jgi:hypothetical protein